jgi:drug/metabolite transporter (DMT)-like permease
VALYLPCYDSGDPHGFWACTPPVWRTPTFLALALADAVCVGSFYIAMLHAPRYVTGGEVAMVMMLEDVLGPLWVYLRFGDVPSSWVVAGGVLLLGTLAWHELAARRHGAARRQAESVVAMEQVEAEERPYHSLRPAKA